MLALQEFFGWFNLIIIPLSIFNRYQKNRFLIFLNPLLYLVIFAYFYLNFSSLFLWDYVQSRQSHITFYTESSIQASSLFCYWFTFVFFFFYQFSKDKKYIINTSFSPRQATYIISLVLAVLVSLFFVYLIGSNLSFLISLLFIGRGLAVELYGEQIRDKYPINPLTTMLMISTTVLVWKTRDFKWFLLLLLPSGLLIFSQARAIAFKCLIFAYINYVAITKKTGIFFIILTGLLIVGLALYRTKSEIGSWQDYIYISLGDIFESRHTTTITYRKFLEHADLGQYFFCSFINPIPLGLEQDFCDAKYLGSGYDDILRDFYQERLKIFYSLDGNIVSESLFYGGTVFGFISPIIIGSIFYILNQIAIYKTFPGFIYTCLLLSDLRGFMRDSFYDNFINTIVIMLFYYFWLIVLEKDRAIVTKISSIDAKQFIKMNKDARFKKNSLL